MLQDKEPGSEGERKSGVGKQTLKKEGKREEPSREKPTGRKKDFWGVSQQGCGRKSITRPMEEPFRKQ